MSIQIPAQSGDGAITASLIGAALYTAQDLALCSTEEARARISYESALKMSVLPLALVRSKTATKIHCAVFEDSLELRRALKFVCGLEPEFSEVS